MINRIFNKELNNFQLFITSVHEAGHLIMLFYMISLTKSEFPASLKVKINPRSGHVTYSNDIIDFKITLTSLTYLMSIEEAGHLAEETIFGRCLYGRSLGDNDSRMKSEELLHKFHKENSITFSVESVTKHIDQFTKQFLEINKDTLLDISCYLYNNRAPSRKELYDLYLKISQSLS